MFHLVGQTGLEEDEEIKGLVKQFCFFACLLCPLNTVSTVFLLLIHPMFLNVIASASKFVLCGTGIHFYMSYHCQIEGAS